MHARPLLIAAAALTFAAVAAAEPAKTDIREANPPAKRPVVLASADDVRTPTPAPQESSATTPAKPVRHGRVTTCRCADQIEH